MHDCQFKSRLPAYHDAELSAAEIEAVNEHLPTCETCSAELAVIREVSAALATYQPDEISQIELSRLHCAIDRAADDGGVLRLAGMLGALAASVLIICMAWISQGSVQNGPVAIDHAVPTPEWERLAMGGPTESPSMPKDLNDTGPRDSGLAYGDDTQTIDFMLSGIQGLNAHEGR
jgi:anti-sigma factor RsiW